MLCSLRERIDAVVMPLVDFATAKSPAAVMPKRMPRHAAAVLVAAGLLGCGGAQYSHDDGVAEAAPPPYYDTVGHEDEPVDAGTQGENGDLVRYDMRGVDSGTGTVVDAGVVLITVDAGTPDTGVAVPDDRFQYDDGVAEAAPPPYDDRFRYDHGVAEAAPPPVDYKE